VEAPAEGGSPGLFSSDFLPHSTCYLRQPEIVWLHVVSDALIASAYYSIPLILFWFVARRRDVPFTWMFALFGVFILACGTTHLMEIVTVWYPIYGISGLVKAATAAVSLTAAIGLVPIMPKALALPSLRATNAQLLATGEELRRSNRELEQFAYVAAHDLQEPLRMVAMNMDLLERRHGGALDDDARQWIARARHGSLRMRALINDLLAYTRLDNEAIGRLACDAGDAAREAIANLQAEIAASGTAVACGELPLVRCERGQLVQLFQNLIGNAIKYGAKERPVVAIAAAREGAEVVISVQDNGIGIDPGHHQRIFEVFQRLHRRDEYPGTGIGLAICKKVVERHAGRIWVESRLGEGATFRFTLPAAA
jgi:chemotaxis family two-component system sensor kinase Cph1